MRGVSRTPPNNTHTLSVVSNTPVSSSHTFKCHHSDTQTNNTNSTAPRTLSGRAELFLPFLPYASSPFVAAPQVMTELSAATAKVAGPHDRLRSCGGSVCWLVCECVKEVGGTTVAESNRLVRLGGVKYEGQRGDTTGCAAVFAKNKQQSRVATGGQHNTTDTTQEPLSLCPNAHVPARQVLQWHWVCCVVARCLELSPRVQLGA